MQPVADPKPLKYTLRRLFVVVTAAAVFFSGIFYFISFRAESLRRKGNLGCESSLRQIGLALNGYESVHGCFPPPYVTDAQGNPLYSWRVLILPYLDERLLYDQWRLDEPWDSPHNRSLPLPRCFSCPVAERNRQGGSSPYTDYMAVVAPGFAWEEGKSLSLADFVDDWRKTIMVVEVRGSQTHWAEPVDFDGTSSLKFNARQGLSIGSHRAGANVMLGECSVMHLPDSTSEEEIKASLTRAGGENEPWCEEGRADNVYPGYWFGDLRWTGESWVGLCECVDRELPFSIDFDVADPTDQQKALALVATRKVRWDGLDSRDTLDAPQEEKTRLDAAQRVLGAIRSQSHDTLADEDVQQLADDMTLQSWGIAYAVDDAAAFPYLVYTSAKCLPNRKIRVRFSTDPTNHERRGEVMVIKAIDEVTTINE